MKKHTDFYYSSVTVRVCDEIGKYVPVSDIRVPYRGAWALAKGDSVAQEEEQQQATFSQQLMTLFQQQYATQTNTISYLQGKMQPMIDNPTGYSASDLAAQRTSASDTNATQFSNAQQALAEQTQQRAGGSKLAGTSGADVEAMAALDAQEAQVEANSQNQITTNNANLAQQNYWNAVNALNGTAVEANPLGYSGAATSGANSVADLSQAVTASQQSQLLGALGGVTGGLGGALITKYCWVAASFYGWDDIRTSVIRSWIKHSAPRWFSKFYIKHGEWIASTPLRWAFRPLFEIVLASSILRKGENAWR